MVIDLLIKDMDKNTAELLQEMIDIKKNTRSAIENKGVEIVGGMKTYPAAVSDIPQEITGLEYDFTRAGWLPSMSAEWSNAETKYLTDSLNYTSLMWGNYGNYMNWPDGYEFERYGAKRPPGWNKLVIAPNILNFELNRTLVDGSYITGGLFKWCYALRYVPTFDTSRTTYMNNWFHLCTSLVFAPYLDTSNVTNMYSMFYNCYSLVSIPLYNTSKVKDMGYMFYNCYLIESIPQFDTSNVENMNQMFYGCNRLKSIPKLNANSLKKAVDIFYGCGDLTDFGGFENLKVSVAIDYVVGGRMTNMSKQSVLNVIDGLYDWVGNSQGLDQSEWDTNPTITGALRVDLTDDEIAVATNKGWTLR